MKTALLRTFACVLIALSSLAIADQEDWNQIKTKEGSLTMKLPQGWLIADAEDAKSKEAYENFKKNNPEMAKNMTANGSDKQIIQLFDTNDPVNDGFLNAMNIAKQPSGGLTVGMYKDVVKALGSSIPHKGSIENKVIDIPAGKALTYWTTMVSNGVDGKPVNLDILGVMFLSKENVYIATFLCGEGQLKANRETWDKIIKTFKIS